MANKNTDRRILHKKKYLKEALIRLLKDKTIDRISIMELCEKAEINRKTFYAHYSKVEDVLEELEQETAAEMVKRLKAFPEEQGDYSYLNYVKENREIYLTLMSNRSSRLKELVAESTSGFFTSMYDQSVFNKDSLKLCMKLTDYSSMLLIEHWLENDCRTSVEEISEQILCIGGATYHGFKDYLLKKQ